MGRYLPIFVARWEDALAAEGRPRRRLHELTLLVVVIAAVGLVLWVQPNVKAALPS